MKPTLVTAPASDPVTLEDVKEHLRVFYADDDELLGAYIKAAVSHLDGYRGILNRCIVSQQWKVTRCNWCRRIETVFTDTTAAVVKYFDASGTEQTVDPASYRVYPDYIRFSDDFAFPALATDRDDRISITTTHGYAEVPESLTLAIKILIAHWYRNREPVSFGGNPMKIPHSVDALLAPHRWAF
ncbi:head-tail connector protein [Ensifer aridi]|uniref:head-tail connector protein n=1 Tax=Ensifer aridi TaxID=1708715 RepID=UPI000A10FAFD|nr:head-tail connector protein [Ensifer aridi]